MIPRDSVFYFERKSVESFQLFNILEKVYFLFMLIYIYICKNKIMVNLYLS